MRIPRNCLDIPREGILICRLVLGLGMWGNVGWSATTTATSSSWPWRRRLVQNITCRFTWSEFSATWLLPSELVAVLLVYRAWSCPMTRTGIWWKRTFPTGKWWNHDCLCILSSMIGELCNSNEGSYGGVCEHSKNPLISWQSRDSISTALCHSIRFKSRNE